MQLFYSERSPYARKVRAVAIEKDVRLELVEVNAHDLPPRLLAHNPLSKVPVLVTTEGQTLVDSWVIAEYLDARGAGPRLIPEGIAERYALLSFAAIAQGMLDAAVPAVMETMRPSDKIHPPALEKQRQVILRAASYFNGHVAELEQPNLASVSLCVALDYVEQRLSRVGLPVMWRDGNAELSAWFDAFSKRDSIARTAPVSWERATAA